MECEWVNFGYNISYNHNNSVFMCVDAHLLTAFSSQVLFFYMMVCSVVGCVVCCKYVITSLTHSLTVDLSTTLWVTSCVAIR
jgi:hypothetical protein